MANAEVKVNIRCVINAEYDINDEMLKKINSLNNNGIGGQRNCY